MCGIAGFISFNAGSSLSAEGLCKMTDAISHRGPDGEGYLFVGDAALEQQAKRLREARQRAKIDFVPSPLKGFTAGLSHRRLSIIDLSTTADQPMSAFDGSQWIVFNGEIYNHAEIRQELMTLGHHFKTDHSDTEVILNAYRQWGIEAIHRLRGMFAFALLDLESKKAWFVRDRIGVKPLYWFEKDGLLLFASEIKALLRSGLPDARLRAQSAYDYLSFLTVPAPHTMYQDIYKLEASTWMSFDFKDGSRQRYRYWDPFDGVEKNRALSVEDWQERLLEELRTSVRYRMVSDVPVGVFLSGGIDSSANAALFAEERKGHPIKTFTIGYDESLTHENEFKYASLMARKIGSQHFETRIKLDDLLSFLPKLVFHQDEPIADPVCIPLYFVTKLARDNGVTVCQVGEGSDELFIGYSDWLTKYRLERAGRIPGLGPLKALALTASRRLGLSTETAREFLARNTAGQPVFWSGAEAFTETEKAALIPRRIYEEFNLVNSAEQIRKIHDDYLAVAPEDSAIDWMTYADLKLRLPELLLMRVDKMTMACALEARVPFLDHVFVQLALSVPGRLKIRGGRCKALLKDAVRPILPEEIVDRKKQGFSVPVTEWLSQKLGGVMQEAIFSFNRETGFFDEDELHRLFKIRHRGLWPLFNLALWHKARTHPLL